MKARGVHVVFHYVPLHTAPAAADHADRSDCPVTDDVSERLVRLPASTPISGRRARDRDRRGTRVPLLTRSGASRGGRYARARDGAAVDLATPDARAAQPRDPEPRRTQRFGRFGAFARSRWAAPTFVAIAPIVILVVLRVSPYFRLNNGDPFIYIGYANDFRGHVVRFGYTYYAVRWA
jgi:hypothetical protein